jgi:hypothetical protein
MWKETHCIIEDNDNYERLEDSRSTVEPETSRTRSRTINNSTITAGFSGAIEGLLVVEWPPVLWPDTL